MSTKQTFVLGATIVFALLFVRDSRGQELEARAFSPSPVGTTFVLGGFGKSQGGILFDPALDIDNVQADLWVATAGVGHTFDLAGRQARALAVFPIAWGTIEGSVHEQAQRQDLAGLVNPRLKLSVGLIGAPALSLAEFARAPRQTAVGVSVTVVPPLGQYTSQQLVNLGYNRWALKPEIGVSRPVGRWTIDGSAGVWLFTTNDSFYPAHATKRQDPVVALQGHASYALLRVVARLQRHLVRRRRNACRWRAESRFAAQHSRRCHSVGTHRRTAIHQVRLQHGDDDEERIGFQYVQCDVAARDVLSRMVSIAKVFCPAIVVIVPLVAAAFWVPPDPPLLRPVLLFLWGVGAILVAERLVFSGTVRESLRALGFVRARMSTVVVALLVTLPMWAFLPLFARFTGIGVTLRPGWIQLLVGVVLVNGITEEAIHRGFVFGHLCRGRTFMTAATISATLFAAQHLYIIATMGPTVGLASVMLALLLAFPMAFVFERGGNSIVGPAILHTSSNAPAIMLVLPQDVMATALVMHMGVTLGSIYLVFLVKQPRSVI